MAGHRKWSEIRTKAPPEAPAAAERKTEAMLAALELDELRRRLGISQEGLAERLQTSQSNVSRTLRRGDMHVSTLRDVLAAMGVELELTARLPDGERVRLPQFEQELDDDQEPAVRRG